MISVSRPVVESSCLPLLKTSISWSIQVLSQMTCHDTHGAQGVFGEFDASCLGCKSQDSDGQVVPGLNDGLIFGILLLVS